MGNEEKKTYIGTQAVTSQLEKDDAVTYILEDYSGATVTKEQFESMAKPEPYDDVMVRVNKWLPAVRDVMGVLLKNNLSLLEKDFVIGRIDETVVQNYGRASAKLFGADHEANITLSQIDKVLKS